MTTEEIIAARKIFLTNCDREPIHLSGSIQPHGVLFVLQEPELTILQVSSNSLEIFGISPDKLLDRNLSMLLHKSKLSQIRECLASEDLQSGNPLKLSVQTETGLRFFDCILHRTDGVLILELEPAMSQNDISFFGFYHSVRTASSKIQAGSNLAELCQNIVGEVRKITGFDRVMVYKFDAEGNGAIVAEDKQEHLPTWLDLHYPATDIPTRSRKLYAENCLRLIADVNYQPVKIIPANNPITDSPLDLSSSVLRSVSPLHIEYLQNMGVGASMSVSLMKDKQLWGLVACHHYSPKYVSYEIRAACKFLAQVMSVELSAKEYIEDYDYKLKLKSVNTKFIQYMSEEENFIEGLFKHQPNLLDFIDVGGAAACFGSDCQTIGTTPNQTDIEQLIKWLKNNYPQEIFSTRSLAKFYPDAENLKNVASGLIAISISQTQGNYILWFRPEEIQTVNWAGDPNQPVDISTDGSLRLSPRKSFALWKETVKLTSLPWKQCEIEAAIDLRNSIVSIVLKKADEMAKINAALQASEAKERQKAIQLELAIQEIQATQTQLIQSEKMASLGQLVAGVAHEINNPINFIYGNLAHADDYAKSLLQLINLYDITFPSPGDEIIQKTQELELEFLMEDLPRLLGSMKIGAERIRTIVDALRVFSRVDESEIKQVNIHDGIDSTLLILGNRLRSQVFAKERSAKQPGIQVIKEYGQLPKIQCYAGHLNQVFMNIISNAIDALEEDSRYSAVGSSSETSPLPTIRIRTEMVNSEAIAIKIADNGPGMSEEVQRRLFDPFFTTKTLGKGTGIGLAISYAVVVQKHGGNLTCISAPGQGAEFIIELPLKPRLS